MSENKSNNKEKQYSNYKKQKKVVVVFAIIWLILLVITLGFKFAISQKSPLYYDYLFAIMPKSIDTVFDEKDLTLYIEKNENFDKEKNQPLDAFNVYYYENNDTSTEKKYLENGSAMKGVNESTNVMILQFLGNATISDGIIRKVINNALTVLFVLLVPYLIYIWYITWSIRYDKNKAMTNKFDKE